MLKLALLIVGIVLCPLAASVGSAFDGDGSTSAKRVALVIGNGDYLQEGGRLRNPANDARAIASKLRALQFDVIEALDLDRKGMQTTLRQFDRMLSSDLEAALFFYAGHAMEYHGQNYLFPVDAELEAESDINLGLVRISEVLGAMAARDVPLRLIFLDACRENPIAERFVRSFGANRSSLQSRGLAVINAPVDAARGTFVAYATAPGDVAKDGDGDHSPFTAALLDHLDAPGLDADDLMERVRISVAEATGDAQIPWSSSSLRGDFVFNRGPSAADPPQVAALTEPSEEPEPSAPSEPPGAFERSLSLDDKYKVQEALSSLGYEVGDSYVSEFRAHIKNAIANWQADAGWPRTGQLTRPQFARLLEGAGLLQEREPEEPDIADQETRPEPAQPTGRPPTGTPSTGTPDEIEAGLSLTKRQRVELQFSLARLGHYTDARIDGIFGPRSREAIGAWQRETGSDESGYLTEVQVASLYVAALPALDAFRETYRPAGSTFRDCTSCPDMVVIPAGRFLMGSSRTGRTSERPAHRVRIATFALGKFEVTFGEWSACVRDGRCRETPPTGDRQPVVGVTWHDARDYADWLSAVTGERYTLPSEAQWEYAARAGTETAFVTGSGISAAQANFDGRRYGTGSASRFRGRTLVGGSFPANAFGLHDMHGNVREWVRDRWHDSYLGAPRDGGAWLTGGAVERVQRGGSWRDDARMLRSAARAKADPDAADAHTGFRVARKIGN